MSSTEESIRSVSWRDLCPWLLILKAIPVSAGMGIIILSTLGVVLTPLGWWVSGKLFVTKEIRDADYHFSQQVDQYSSPYASLLDRQNQEKIDLGLISSRITGPALVFRHKVEPFYHMFHDIRGMRRFCYYATGCIWTLLVWAFFGVATCRIAMIRLTRDERIGIDDAFGFALQKYPTSLGAFGIPLITVALICLPLALAGLLMTFDVGVVLMGICWIIVLLMVILIVILLVGLLFGWPLMISAVAAEGHDSFDSLTRSFAYTFQKPLHYIFYAVVALVIGGIIWVIAARATEATINLAYWTTSWGANVSDGDRIDTIRNPDLANEQAVVDSESKRFEVGKNPVISDRPDDAAKSGDGKSVPGDMGEFPRENQSGKGNKSLENKSANETPANTDDTIEITEPSGSLVTGNRIIVFWNSLIKTIAAGFLHGLFWCLSSAIYLLLRRDVDDTELDEVFIDNESQTFELPPLKNDQDGIPQVAETSEENDPSAESVMPDQNTLEDESD